MERSKTTLTFSPPIRRICWRPCRRAPAEARRPRSSQPGTEMLHILWQILAENRFSNISSLSSSKKLQEHSSVEMRKRMRKENISDLSESSRRRDSVEERRRHPVVLVEGADLPTMMITKLQWNFAVRNQPKSFETEKNETSNSQAGTRPASSRTPRPSRPPPRPPAPAAAPERMSLTKV